MRRWPWLAAALVLAIAALLVYPRVDAFTAQSEGIEATGRQRSGSSRSPIWVGGGTVFGPTPRDYSYRMPRTARR